jgi:unsaturated rhamnogalacturonyl hydrolase
MAALHDFESSAGRFVALLGAACVLAACGDWPATPGAPDRGGSEAGGDAGDVAMARRDGAADASSTLDAGADQASQGTDGTTAGDAACGAALGTLSATSLSVSFADSILARWPDPRNVGGSAHGWDYTVGVVLQGMGRVYERTGDARYLAYIQQYVDDFVDGAGNNSGLPPIPPSTNYDLDNFEPGNLLLFLYQQTGKNAYALAAQSLLALLGDYPRNADGGFWHKGSYPNQMWLDGIYMAEPFIAGHGALFSSCGSLCDTTPGQQIALVAQHTVDPSSGLLYHAWDESLSASWANATTGRSPVIWSRGLGWFGMALIDVLRVTPPSNPDRPQLIQLLQSLASGLAASQDAATGLWYQVVSGGCPGNYIETSGSGMFIYALEAGVDACYLDPSYRAVAQRAWTGLQAEVTSDSLGPVIPNAVAPMSVEDSCAAYVAQPRVSNSGQGLCGVLMAATQME